MFTALSIAVATAMLKFCGSFTTTLKILWLLEATFRTQTAPGLSALATQGQLNDHNILKIKTAGTTIHLGRFVLKFSPMTLLLSHVLSLSLQ
jgi:hypothetical protein